jgi:hypothetical protein
MATDEELLEKPITFISDKVHTITNCGYTVMNVMIPDFKELGLLIATYLDDINKGIREQYNCDYNIVAINSNFINYSLIGYESLLKRSDDSEQDPADDKAPKRAKKPKKVKKKSSRARQGNGSSFNSSVQLDVKIMKLNIKPYILKCFPQTGYVQITGVKHEDMSDAKKVIISVVQELLHIKGVVDPIIDVDAIFSSIKIGLINYKFNIIMKNKKILLDAHKINYYLGLGELFIPNAKIILKSLEACDNKVIFKVQFDDAVIGKRTQITTKIYYSGKINITGVKYPHHSDIIYEFLYNFFDIYWYDVVALKMRTDAELLQLTERLARDKRKQHELYLKTKEILMRLLPTEAAPTEAAHTEATPAESAPPESAPAQEE